MVYITVVFIFLSSPFALLYEIKALQNSTQLLEFQLTILEKFRRQKNNCVKGFIMEVFLIFGG